MNHKDAQPVYITTGTMVRVVLVLLFVLLLYLIRDIALVILTAVVIASAIEPATRWFEVRNVPRVLAVILIYLLTFLFVAIGFYLFIPPLLDNVLYIIERAPDYAESLRVWGGLPAPFDSISGNFTLGNVVTGVEKSLAGLSTGILGVATSIFGGVLSFVLVVVFSFYLAVQRDGIANFLRIVTPIQYESYIIDLWGRTQRKIGRWLQGQLLLSLLVGILVYLGLMVLGVPNAFVLAMLAAVFELIPLFGPVLAAVPAIAVALIDGGTSLGIMAFLLYVIIQQFENHLLYPLVTNKVVGLPALVVITALLIGGKLAGFIGVILAVPIAAGLMEFASDIEKRKKRVQENGAEA
ncbi:MAG: AI-2E family transporter [Candidatus Paceibacterota bacterium]